MRAGRSIGFAVVLMATAVAVSAGPAAGGGPPAVVSGASPFAPGGCGVNTDILHTEHDGTVAVQPGDPAHLVGVWTQDNTLSSVVAGSFDGGTTWQKALIPNLTRCTGSQRWDMTFDPWVSVGPDGTAYMSSVVNTAGTAVNPIPLYGLAVSRSADGGRTWDAAQFPIESSAYGVILDKSAVTADATRAGHAHAVTTMLPNVLLHSRTADGGITWTPARPIYAGKPGFFSFGSEILSLPDGSLLNVFGEWPVTFFPAAVTQQELLAAAGDNEVLAMRSTDGGETWSLPSTVVRFPPWLARDPDTGSTVVAPWRVVRSAVGTDGSISVVWEESVPGDARIRLTRSTDGGATWSPPVDVVTAPDQVVKPAVAVTGTTTAVTFYDFRGDQPGDGEVTTDVWMRWTTDAGLTWQEVHLGGPFDLRRVPTSYGNGMPTGDYAGLVPLSGSDFGAFFQRGGPPDTTGATDVFFGRVATAPSG